MKSTLYLKFALLYIVFGFLSLFTTSILGQQLLLNQLENNASQSLYKEANVMATTYLPSYFSNNMTSWSVHSQLSAMKIYLEATLWFVEEDGTLITSSNLGTATAPAMIEDFDPDFLTVYSYSYLLLQQDGVYFGKRSLDSNFTKNQLDIFKEVLKEEEFEPAELHITEWNFTISNRNCINDSCAQGAYVMKTCIESVGNVDMMGFWHGSDLHSEFYDTDGVLYGESGLLSRDGIKKPSFYAFHFLYFLQSDLLGKTENALLSTNGHGNYTIVCHNCKQLNYRYTMKEEKDIDVKDIGELYEDLDAIHLKFEIRNVENGDYIMRSFYVNPENGSVQELWRDMEYLRDLSKGEIEYLRRNATPKVEMRKIHVEDGILRVETKLLAHEIRALDIHYQY